MDDRSAGRVDDVMRDLPVLETKRLLLRKMTLNDAGNVFAYASDPEVTRYLSWDTHRTIDDSLVFLRRVIREYEAGTCGTWGIELKDEGRFIGTVGFVWQPDNEIQEIGYVLARPYWGQGFTTECVREVIRFGFDKLGLNRIQAACEPDNIGSWRVMEKSGMRYEGTLREWTFSKGRWIDIRMYAILRRDFERTDALS